MNIDGKERTRVTSDGHLAVGEYLGMGQLRAPIHVRNSNFVPRIKSDSDSMGILIEGIKNTLAFSGQSHGYHVNGVVFGSSPASSGSPDYWIMSQRGPSDQKFGSNSFVFGHSDDRSDVEGKGLDELKKFEVAVSVGENGKVCISCERVTSNSKMAVGGAVEAPEYLLYGDEKLLRETYSVVADKRQLMEVIGRLKVRVCEWQVRSSESLRTRYSLLLLVPSLIAGWEQQFEEWDGEGEAVLSGRSRSRDGGQLTGGEGWWGR